MVGEVGSVEEGLRVLGFLWVLAHFEDGVDVGALDLANLTLEGGLENGWVKFEVLFESFQNICEKLRCCSTFAFRTFKLCHSSCQ